MSGSTLFRLIRLLVRASAPLVPRDRRDEWLKEWEGELWHAAHRSRAGGWTVTRRAVGALRHALWMRRQEWTLERLADDVRFAFRAVVRAPGFTAVVVVTLALGIGTTTAIYSIVDGVLLRPLPYPGGERLVRVSTHFARMDASLQEVAHAPFLEWRERTRSLDALEGYSVVDANLVGDGPPTVIQVGRVTAGLLPMLGIEALRGRLFMAGENEPGAGGVAVLSHRLWLSRYGGDPDVVGRLLRLDEETFRIVGVMPPNVHLLPEVDVWTPVTLEPRYAFVTFGGLVALGRLRAGLELEDARAELDALALRLAREMPDSQRGVRPEVASYRETLVGDVRTNLLLLMASVVAVLLIACVNVANLFLARGTRRTGEMAIRATLGASRSHLTRQLLTEGLFLALLGGALGLVLARWGVDALLGILPEGIPLATSVGLDGRVLLFALAATAGTALLFALLPALRASRSDVRGALGEGRRATGDRRAQKLGRGLLVVEVAQAVVLLVVGGLLVNTLVRMHRADPGFDPEGLLLVQLTLPEFRYEDPVSRAAFRDELLGRLRGLPGVRSAGAASATPFSGHTSLIGLDVEGGATGDGATGVDVHSPNNPDLRWTGFVRVSPGYVRTLGLPVLRGRPLTSRDAAEGARVAVVSETLARAFWAEGDAVGRRVRSGGDPDEPWVTVVGIVGDLKHPGFTSPNTARMYVPDPEPSPKWPQHVNFVLRTTGDPGALAAAVRREIWAADEELPIPTVAPMTQRMAESLAQARFYALVLGLFSALAVALAAVGIYGVFSYRVARRTHEMGIRMALGARVENVRRMVLRQGLATAAVGIVLGVAGGAAAARVAEGLLYGVEPVDPATYAAVAALVLAVALAAVYVPARRATRVDPVEALRSE